MTVIKTVVVIYQLQIPMQKQQYPTMQRQFLEPILCRKFNLHSLDSNTIEEREFNKEWKFKGDVFLNLTEAREKHTREDM